MNIRKALLSLAVLLLTAAVCSSQNSVNSPYSRFGIGFLNEPGSPRHFGLGGVATSIIDGHVINFQNPATYAHLNETTFQVSGKGSRTELTNGLQSSRFNSGAVNEIALGFKKENSRYAFVLGLTPYSTSGYNLESSATLNDSIEARYRYSGDGGINRALIGISRSFELARDTTTGITHRLYAGVNINYLFGSIEQTRKVYYDNLNIRNTRVTNKTNISDFYFDAGLHYSLPLSVKTDQKKLISGSYLLAGMDYALGNSMNARISSLGETFIMFSGAEITTDTSFFSDKAAGTFALPQKWSAGLSWLYLNSKGGSIQTALEFRTQDWSGFALRKNDSESTDSEAAPLKRNQHLAFGIEFTPQGTEKATNIIERITYRAGVRHTTTNVELRGEPIAQRAVSAGLSIPLMASRSDSRIHLGAEWGISGTTRMGLLEERFLNFQVGFTLSPFEKWFVQRKYD